MSSARIAPEDCIVLFADLQQGIIELSKTQPLDALKKSVGALAQLAKLFEMPVIITGIMGEDGSPAKITPEISAALGELPTHHRTTCDSLLNPAILAAIHASGRKTLLISGVATELAVQLPAVSTAENGLRAFVVIDACGGISARTEQAALQRVAAAGGSTVSVMTLAGELAGDLTQPKAQQAVGILFAMAQ